MKAGPILFDDFVVGAELGTHQADYDDKAATAWRAIFGSSQPEGAEGAGVAIALMMRSYLAVATPRPPGNVHARQQLALQALPRPGETVRTRVWCAGKEIKRERRYVEIGVQAAGDQQRPLFDGRLTLVWAA